MYDVTMTPYVIEFAAVAALGRADAGTVYVQCRACGRYGIKPQPHACAAILGLKLGNWFATFDTVVAIRARQLKNAYRLMNYLSTPADAPVDAQEALEVPPALGDLTDAPALAPEVPCLQLTVSSITLHESSSLELMDTAP